MHRRISLLAVVMLLAAACAGNLAPDRQIEDAAVAQRVRDVLAADSGLRDQRIDVSVASGAVALTGQVRSQADRERAETLARGVAGVNGVQNLLSAP